jgi:hypothetical protein
MRLYDRFILHVLRTPRVVVAVMVELRHYENRQVASRFE